jgi:uncharacterized protein
MQPIQRHEWADEDREPIERHAPFLSALDFLRFLRGEDVDIEYLQREPPALEEPDEALPVHRLRETYRLPPESARLHTDLFYADDGIELESAAPERSLVAGEGVLGDVLDSTERVTLIVHDEAGSQKVNPVEQALIAALLEPVDVVESGDGAHSEGITAGVVVPFRAQRRDVVGVAPQAAAVDTVERFQGGERDLMVLSMTASDRGYISQISEFLLEPNRFNVGASRMQRKLVVLASAGLFEESSDEVERFEQQEAWISFFRGMGGLDDGGQEFSLREVVGEELEREFLGDVDRASDVSLQVYSGYDSERL